MDWKSNLRRSQSLRSVSSSCDKPTWTEAGLRDKKASVSQLVSRYQTTLDVSTSTQAASVNNGEAKLAQVLKEESKDTYLECLMRRNDEKLQSRAKTNLSRSKSMGSLQNSTGSIKALKALFESKAATQNKVKSNFRAAHSTSAYKAAHIPVINGDTEEVVNNIRKERRKTIGGIDFEEIAASEFDEKRRSIGDFRDSSFIHNKEKLGISVKAMSAHYLSKVAPQDTNHSLLKPVQDQPSEMGKSAKLSKMLKESQQRRDDLPPPTSARHEAGPEDASAAHSQQSMPDQLSKEKLYQQRQKCELRRLMKHTHPELKMLDEVVDDELAEVLGSESGLTAGETGYEGEVLTRRLIFENKVSAYTPKMHITDRKVERANVSKTSAVFEGQEEKPLHSESVEGMMMGEDKTFTSGSFSNREFEKEIIKTDVQATRRIFESQSVNMPRTKPDNKLKGQTSNSGEEMGAVQKHKPEFKNPSKENMHSENKSSSTDVTEWLHKQVSHDGGQSPDLEFSDKEEVSTVVTIVDDDPANLSGPEGFEEMFKTSADLFKNNPFISKNIERENSYVLTSVSQIPANPSGTDMESLITNVKNRAHLFESMPFDRIRHQNKDEVETMVENIKETLNCLYHVNAIHSDGSIIEVNETMIAKKAKFTLSESGPMIKYDEVAEGGAQNFLLQLIPRANLKPQITYLKEDSKGCKEATVVNVPLQHHQFTTSQDTQFKTANMVQLVEDMLNQDNSLRKGVIIQEDETSCAEVIVYSLYNYFDEEDVKSYSPQADAAENDEPETEKSDTSKAGNQGVRKGIVKSTINCLTETSQDQSCPRSITPELTVKGNVKLFKSCIEKGDLEYLKTLQAVEEQELAPNQTVAGQVTELLHEHRGDQAEESASEWAPVDIKRLKSMFSGDQKQTQTKQRFHKNHAAISPGFTGQNVAMVQTPAECNIGVFSHGQEKKTFREECASPLGSYTHLETRDKDTKLLQADLVEAVDENDEMSNLQGALPSLQQATTQTKSLSPHEKQKFFDQVSGEEPVLSVTAGDAQHSELSPENENQKVDSFADEPPLTFNVPSKHKSNHKYSAVVGSFETAPAQQLEEECVFEGKLQAALESLGRSNINITKGDFRAAMIYRNSSKPLKESSQNVDIAAVKESTVEGPLCPVTEAKSPEVPLRQEKEDVTVINAECQSQSQALYRPAISKKIKGPVGPKPAIPPKPEHLKIKQTGTQSANTRNPETTQTNASRPEMKTQRNKEPVLQPPAKKSASCMDGNKTEPSKTKSSADLEAGHKDEDFSQDSQEKYQVQGFYMTLESDNTDKNTLNKPEVKNAEAEETRPKDFSVKDTEIETDDSRVEFHEACQKFGGKKAFAVKSAPVKPKRVKIAQPDIHTHVDPKPQQTLTGQSSNNTNTSAQSVDSKDGREKEMKQESKVELREKKGRTETEDECRQQLSVHIDEIVKGNITAAMEIFDNLRKQEELQCILSQVEDIEQDTSEVDVRSLRKVFENIPDWVVSEDKKREKKVKVEDREEKSLLLSDNTESKSSMAHVFGDLERASEEIMNLKEQTLARLKGIEEAIKKALYSVSTLKSDSDIAGLSCLFKESLGAVQESPLTGNISRKSIGSSRTKSQQAEKRPTSSENEAQSAGQSAGAEAVFEKQQASPLSSPAFASIQSAARRTTPSTMCPTCQQNQNSEKIFRTTMTLTSNSRTQNRKGDHRKGAQHQSTYNSLGTEQELGVLEVHTDSEGNSVAGTKTGTEGYERTDNVGNQFHSTKTSTVVITQPEAMTSAGQTLVRPTHQDRVTTQPEVRQPINQKP
ncbi:LIM domain-containing protein isoform X2 [Channa argus]|uniref:LIM domain-containing protein isoform X2 n=1 Tax=Channa argus TaxID=215402 RepID=UPI003521C351